MVKVSVIIPVYNSEKYLNKCLDSLVNQTLRDIEIIIVNDGSTDNSEKIIKSYLNDSRINYFAQENQGQAAARNRALKLAKGEYISFVDSDDYVDENMFTVLYDMIKKAHAKIAICGWYLVENGQVRTCQFKCDRVILNDEQAIDMLLNYVSFDNFACNKLFHYSLFKNNTFPIGKVLEDLLTIYKLINEAKIIVVDSIPLYYYVLHSNSITSNLYKQVDPQSFCAFEDREKDLLLMYPKLTNKIKSNYFTANRHYFTISIHSLIRDKKFEKVRIKEMRKNVFYVLIDKSIPFRVKVSSIVISIVPYLFKVRK